MNHGIMLIGHIVLFLGMLALLIYHGDGKAKKQKAAAMVAIAGFAVVLFGFFTS